MKESGTAGHDFWHFRAAGRGAEKQKVDADVIRFLDVFEGGNHGDPKTQIT